MKRRFIVFMGIMSLFLVGCSKSKTLDQAMDAALAAPLPTVANHSKPLYRYYVPASVGVLTSSQNSTLFNISGSDVLMNLSISQIVTSEYYSSSEEQNIDFGAFEVEYSYTGSYYDTHSVSRTFTANVLNMDSTHYAILLNNRLVDLIAIVPKSSASLVLSTMVTIMRSVDVDSNLVVSTYSTKEIIDKDAIYSEFFEQIPPENGTLQDMYEQLNPNNKNDSEDTNSETNPNAQ